MNGAILSPPPTLVEVRVGFIDALVDNDVPRAFRIAESANIDSATVTHWVSDAVGLLLDEGRCRQALNLAIGCNSPMHVLRYVIKEWRGENFVATTDRTIVDTLCDHPAAAYLFPDGEEG